MRCDVGIPLSIRTEPALRVASSQGSGLMAGRNVVKSAVALVLSMGAAVASSFAQSGTSQVPERESVEQQLRESRDAVEAARAAARRLMTEAEKHPQEDSSSSATQDPAIQLAQAEWARAIHEKVEPNWIRPASEEPRDYPCRATVLLLHDGTVMHVAFRTPCSSLGLVEKSIVSAIHKSSPLPPPPRPDAFVRRLSIAFSPGAR